MADEQPAVGTEPEAAEAKPEDQASAGTEARRSDQPFLKIFGPEIGLFERELSDEPLTVGRAEDAGIRLSHPRVSRAHAKFSLVDGHYVVEDTGSRYGISVNRQKVERQQLRHGDSVEIGLYVLQFRTHPELAGASEVQARAKLLLRTEYCLLPTTMRLRYRVLEIAPDSIFKSGDTLRVGHGGLLIPTSVSPGESVCLELELVWPNGATKRQLGEVVGVFPYELAFWMCTKLHTVKKETHDEIVRDGKPDKWVDVQAT